MRKARVDDHWRHVRNNIYPNSIKDIEVKGVEGFEDVRMSLSGGINIICGPNGVGKTTFIELVYKLFNRSLDFSTAIVDRLKNLEFHAIGKEHNNEFSIDFSRQGINTTGSIPSLQKLNPSSICIQLIDKLSNDSDLDGLLDPIEPRHFSPEELVLLSYIVGKKYDSVHCFELEDIYGFEAIPFFKVNSRGREYSSLGMGLGELCIFYLFWILNRIDNRSVIFIEEIESHLSPNSQRALMNCIAKFSDENKHFFIISTHSAEILHHSTERSIKLLLPRLTGSELLDPIDLNHCLSALGLSLKTKAIVFVEDDTAKHFVKALFNHFEAQRELETFEIITANGEANIRNILTPLPDSIDTLTFIGMYDGDMKKQSNEYECKWPVFFLPLTSAPDVFLKDLAYENGTGERIASTLRKDVRQIDRELANYENHDHHDWLNDFATALGNPPSVIFSCLFSIWLEKKENLKESLLLVEEILEVLN